MGFVDDFKKGNVGHPPIFKKAEEIEAKVFEFFQHCEDEKEGPTQTGLALFLGFASRQSLHDYKKRSEFSYVIERAMKVVEKWYEHNLLSKQWGGAKFALMNMGWKERVDHTTNDEAMTQMPDALKHASIDDLKRIAGPDSETSPD